MTRKPLGYLGYINSSSVWLTSLQQRELFDPTASIREIIREENRSIEFKYENIDGLGFFPTTFSLDLVFPVYDK